MPFSCLFPSNKKSKRCIQEQPTTLTISGFGSFEQHSPACLGSEWCVSRVARVFQLLTSLVAVASNAVVASEVPPAPPANELSSTQARYNAGQEEHTTVENDMERKIIGLQSSGMKSGGKRPQPLQVSSCI